MKRASVPAAPLLLGLIMSSFMEQNLRRTLTIYGTPLVLLQRPICAVFVLATIIIFVAPALMALFKRRVAPPSCERTAS